MKNRELKLLCYKDALESSLTSVEMNINHLNKIKDKIGIFDKDILDRDYMSTTLDLELSLSLLCILIRKMTENNIITISDDMRVDINSIIHSNRFDYNKNIIVYSRRGEEKVDLGKLLDFTHDLLESNTFKGDNINE